MDEPPRIHHHKSKHRRNASRKSGTDASTVITVQSNDDDAIEASIATATTTVTIASVNEVTIPEQSRLGTDINDDVDIEPNQTDAREEKSIQKGILGYMDREIKTLKKPQSLSDPTASPAQRSIRSRSSIEKSPRQKRSKSESRRRRERKLIAAGELEVKQANETLMRYLKQCSEINDASLSGELEIDKSIDDRRVHRKTKSQRERRHLGGNGSVNGFVDSSKTVGNSFGSSNSLASAFTRDRMPPSGLSSILRELASDVIPCNGEIYNPFTPVVSPTEGPRTNKMFIQTPKGFRSVNDSTFLKSSIHNDLDSQRYAKVALQRHIY